MSVCAGKLERRLWVRFGRVFRVELDGAGLFCAVGRARGSLPMVLRCVGHHARRDEVQARLDAWARKSGLNEVSG